MPLETANPRIPVAVWWAVLAVTVIVGLGGGMLFFFPDVIAPGWLWKVTPFNTRFLGAVYLAEFAVALVALKHDRWSPGRILLYQGLPFALVVTLASILYLDSFDLGRRATWAWFILYAGPLPLAFWFLFKYWDSPPAERFPVSDRLRKLLLIQACVFGAYFAALWIAPLAATGFWPWPIDGLHARMYSAVALALAIGAFVLYRGGARLELLALGLTQVTFGAGAILGLLIVDAAAHRVAWTAPGTWVWIGGLVFLAYVGAVMLATALPSRAHARQGQ